MFPPESRKFRPVRSTHTFLRSPLRNPVTFIRKVRAPSKAMEDASGPGLQSGLGTSPFLFRICAVAFLLVYFFTFAGGGLWAPFPGDDLMNLHGHLQVSTSSLLRGLPLYWSTMYRPLGGIFYLSIYKLFGFHPFPFRIVCFALLLSNLILTYHLAKALSRSREVAVLTTLLVTYHAWFVDLYYSSGTVYELLCFFFYFAALLYYVRIRQTGAMLRPAQWAWLCLLYLGALNAKEMAVTLPLFLGIYELLYFPPTGFSGVGRWLRREFRGALLTGVLTIPYVIGKLLGAGSLTANPAFRPEISAGKYLDTFHLYLNPFFYQDHYFRDSNTVQLLLLMLIVAVWRKSRLLLFSWCFLVLSVLPFIFLPHYAAFFMYIPSVGWSLYFASIIVAVRQRIGKLLPSKPKKNRKPELARKWSPGAVFLFLLLATGLGMAHRAESPKTLAHFRSVQPPSREMIAELSREMPTVAKGTRILFLNDPFPPGDYSLLFLVRLFYHDLSLEIGRRKPGAVPPEDERPYDVAFTFSNDHLSRVSLPVARP